MLGHKTKVVFKGEKVFRPRVEYKGGVEHLGLGVSGFKRGVKTLFLGGLL